ncbi:MAG: HAD-IC family P-type ATPase [Nocardioidaceae bacterium]|nr:HAD-IC family P-type ATPase [Nocardioidaceae bacterium]
MPHPAGSATIGVHVSSTSRTAPAEAEAGEGHAAPWHAIDVDDAFDDLQSGPGGLSGPDAADRAGHFGPNELPTDPGPSALSVLVRQLRSPLIYALMASAAVAFAFGEVVNGAVVLAVVVLNAAIGFVQEFRAGRAISALADMVAEPATVLRGGAWAPVPAQLLVPGDVVAVSAGDRVVADLRVVEGHGVRADESALTGESVPVAKSVPSVDTGAVLAERSSLLHAGTLVSAGSGRGLVVETGSRTALGHVSGLVSDTGRAVTPLTRSIADLGTRVTKAIGGVTVVLLVVALLRGYPIADAALAAITLAVAAVPEGLPAIVTIALAIGVQRMAGRHAIIRELPAVETLGATSVVCTDKTGTLTRNEMTVRHLWVPDHPHGGPSRAAVRRLLVAGVLANEAELSGAGADRRQVGDPTDVALLVAADDADVSRPELGRWARTTLLPFDADNRYMAAVHVEPDGEVVTHVKGAPEVLLAHVPSGVADQARAQMVTYAGEALRVLALGRVRGAVTDASSWDGVLELLGLVAMVDPPRLGVADSIAACHAASVDVKMITGDHPGTATAIGRELGIVGDAPALTGAQIAAMDDAELAEAVGPTAVFARVDPEHKLRLVRALQADGAIVAMTGDGVNDAPALRQADVGVAMGVSGTAAAKQAADVVLGDDDFTTIRAAIEEGRRVYDNLVKALAFALPTNVGEGLVVLVAIVAFPIIDGHPILPIEPVQILWINLVATVSLALPLAFEAKETGLMTQVPRDPARPLLSRFVLVRTVYVGVLMAVVAVGLFLVSLDRSGASLSGDVLPSGGAMARAQTLAVTALMFFQVFYLLMCRTLARPTSSIGWTSNRYVFVGIGAVVVLQIGFVHLPVLQSLFGTTDLGPAQWALAAAAGAIVVPVVGAEKWWRGRGGRQSP